MADTVTDYGPDDWDWAIGTAERLHGDDGVYRLLNLSNLSAGVSAAKLLLAYKRRKRRFRDGRYVQIRQDEYRVA
jgi:electron-transferring-flavoprotein dehydrogenase